MRFFVMFVTAVCVLFLINVSNIFFQDCSNEYKLSSIDIVSPYKKEREKERMQVERKIIWIVWCSRRLALNFRSSFVHTTILVTITNFAGINNIVNKLNWMYWKFDWPNQKSAGWLCNLSQIIVIKHAVVSIFAWPL